MIQADAMTGSKPRPPVGRSVTPRKVPTSPVSGGSESIRLSYGDNDAVERPCSVLKQHELQGWVRPQEGDRGRRQTLSQPLLLEKRVFLCQLYVKVER